jgi:transcription elongation GreA/GreB family factor
MHPADTLPPITVSCTDYNELNSAIRFASDKKTARLLAQMVWLLRCCLAKSRGQQSFRQNCCRHNAVGMNCEVEVRDNIKKAIKHLRIVFPGEEDRGRHGVSVLTPIRAALVSLSEGDATRVMYTCKG